MIITPTSNYTIKLAAEICHLDTKYTRMCQSRS